MVFYQFPVNLVLLLVVATMLINGVQSRNSRAKRDKRGCCPPSYTGEYYRVGVQPARETYYYDAEGLRFVEDYYDSRYIIAPPKGAWVNDDRNCLSSDWKLRGDGNAKSFMCLPTDAYYSGQQQVTLANGNSVIAEVYEMMSGSTRISKYFALDDVNCIPIGEKWQISSYRSIDYVLEKLEVGQPAESKFDVPSNRC